MIQVLIGEGANPNLCNGIGRSPLSEAILIHSLEIATFLVENGANVNAVDADGYSPFHKAVKSDSAKILKYFISLLKLFPPFLMIMKSHFNKNLCLCHKMIIARIINHNFLNMPQCSVEK